MSSQQRKLLPIILLISLSAPNISRADPVPLESLLAEIKVALLKVQQSTESDQLPPLKSATLNATATQKKLIGGKLKLFIIEFGKKKTSELVTTVNIELTPPNANSGNNVRNPAISDLLSEAILSAARAIKSARQGSPPLIASEVKASVKFGVSQDASGKISLEFLPTAPGIDGSSVAETAQEIVIQYKE